MTVNKKIDVYDILLNKNNLIKYKIKNTLKTIIIVNTQLEENSHDDDGPIAAPYIAQSHVFHIPPLPLHPSKIR